MKPAGAPPRLARFLLTCVLRRAIRHYVIGDLEEGYRKLAQTGRCRARRWYWRQVLQSFHPAVWLEMGSAAPRRIHKRKKANRDSILRDIRGAYRVLWKNPGLSAVALVSLSLGIGLTSAAFSLVNALLLRPPNVEQPEQLVEVYTTDPTDEDSIYGFSSYPDFADYREGNEVFSSLTAHTFAIATTTVETRTELLYGEIVSGNYFSTLGIHTVVGRALTPEDDRVPGAHPVVVVSHGLWQRRYGGDPEILGQTIALNGYEYTIIGVAPRSFRGSLPLLDAAFWAPIVMSEKLQGVSLEGRDKRSYFIKGRLDPDVTVEEAEANLQVISKQLAEAYPETNEDRLALILPLSDVKFHPFIDAALMPVATALMLFVGMVLLVACSNVAHLLLARAATRSREMAIRFAMGAGRWRILRQLLSESVLLALLGGVMGLALAYGLTGWISNHPAPLPVPLSLDFSPDFRVLIFSFVISVVTGVLFGLFPAWQASREDVLPALKDEAPYSIRPRLLSFRHLLVVGQVTVSIVLLIGSGLFLRSLMNAQRIDLGFEPGSAVLITLSAELTGYEGEAEGLGFFERVRETARAVPGVESVTLAGRIPPGFVGDATTVVFEGQPLPQKGEEIRVDVTRIDEDYFATMGIPLTQGRGLTTWDQGEAPLVAVVSEAMARRHWPGEDPIGKRLSWEGQDGSYAEVVGVARDTIVRTLGEEPRSHLYISSGQDYHPTMTLLARTSLEPPMMLSEIRHALEEAHPNLAVYSQATLEDHIAQVLYPTRIAATTLTLLGVMVLLLAVVGLYGVMAFSVERRTHEVGVRMALGARRRDVLKLIIMQGMKLVVLGLVLGGALAAGLSRVLESLLYGIRSTDSLTFLGIAVLFIGVALLACWVPARRAANSDPLVTLRHE